jgi:hypothetical protein
MTTLEHAKSLQAYATIIVSLLEQGVLATPELHEDLYSLDYSMQKLMENRFNRPV